MPQGTKINKIEKDLRFQLVAALICREYSTRQILNYVNNPPRDKATGELKFKSWNIKERQLRNYIAGCYRIFRKNTDQKVEDKIARHIAIRQLLFQSARDTGDIKTALEVEKDIANLEGLYKVTIESRMKQEIVITGAPPPVETPEDDPNAGINDVAG